MFASQPTWLKQNKVNNTQHLKDKWWKYLPSLPGKEHFTWKQPPAQDFNLCCCRVVRLQRHKALTYDEPLLSPPPARNPAACTSFLWKLRHFSYFHHYASSLLPPSPPPQSLCCLTGTDSNWAPEPHWQSCLVAIASVCVCVCAREAVFFSVALKQCRSDKDPCFPTWGKSDKYIVPCIFIRSQRSRICAALQAYKCWFDSNYATKHTSLPHTSTGLSRSKVAVPQTCPICFLSSRTNVSHLPRG